MVAGVGGTGVITIGQLLGMAAHIEGKGIVTQDAAGLAQKGGATWSHVLIGNRPEDIHTTRVGMAAADLVIGCDPIVTAGKETVLRMRQGRTHVALNSHSTPTAAFVKNAGWANPADACAAEIAKAVGAEGVGAFDADAAATKLMGDSIYTNPLMLGYAWQKGWIPLGRESLLRAIELNGVAVDNNKAAFEWGRRAAHDPAQVQDLLAPAQVIEFKKRETLEIAAGAPGRVPHRLPERRLCGRATRPSSRRCAPPRRRWARPALAETVARYLFKLMAYKDEYEVARLHTETGFQERIAAQFEGDYKVHFHLAPPLLAKRNARGELVKRKYGPGMLLGFKVLARLRGLRGTPLDTFGRTAGAAHRARPDRRVPAQHRAGAGAAERRQPRAGAGDRCASRTQIRASATSRSATWRPCASAGANWCSAGSSRRPSSALPDGRACGPAPTARNPCAGRPADRPRLTIPRLRTRAQPSGCARVPCPPSQLLLSAGAPVFISSAFAQTAPAAGGDMQSSLMSMLPLVLMFVVLYFVMIRPQMKRQKEHRTMIEALAKGDEVATAGGMLGRVTRLGDTYIAVEVASGVEVQLQRSAVVQVLPKGTLK